MRKTTTFIGAAVIALFAFRCAAPFIWTHPEQDECSFGTVSNAEYRKLLEDAKTRLRTEWGRIHAPFFESANSAEGPVGREFTRRLREMEREPSSIYWQIATIHAVMRAHGAYYVANYLELLEPPRSLFGDLDQEPLPSRFILSYNIDTMHMGSPEPFVRTAKLFPRLSYAFRLLNETAQSQRRHLPNGLDVSVLLPTWVDKNGRFPAQQCPPVPSASWAARFQSLMDGR